MERISLAEYGQSMADAGGLMQLIPLRYFYGINRIREYEQSLIDAAYSVSVYIYGMNLIAEYCQTFCLSSLSSASYVHFCTAFCYRGRVPSTCVTSGKADVIAFTIATSSSVPITYLFSLQSISFIFRWVKKY